MSTAVAPQRVNYARAALNWGRVAFRVLLWGSMALVVDVFAPFWRPARRASQWIMYMWAKRSAWGLGIRSQLIGAEHLAAAPQCVLVANHLSLLDVLILGGYLNLDYRWVAKEGVFKVPIMGQHMKLAGHIPVYRKEPEKNRSLPVRIHEACKQGASLFFFPEGTRSPDGQLQAFRVGAFRTAVDEELPVVPIILRGTDTLLRKGSKDLSIDASCVCTVEVLPPIYPPPGDDPKQRAERMRDEVWQLFADRLDQGRLAS
ncbi:MAG: 1-acyl-sn-glycerol-3-phosphate acyltransferase [Deltaproteobacteria bacterium]|jgi:1-acyl-sn-glycerol-3-phosphate acyltransferase|nr:1-acyl-sn-glycerol-3-phosphate acyltransferase [Deltaproteobacteria bacterium]